MNSNEGCRVKLSQMVQGLRGRYKDGVGKSFLLQWGSRAEILRSAAPQSVRSSHSLKMHEQLPRQGLSQ